MRIIQPCISLVVAEDNPDDRLLLLEAWKTVGAAQLYMVEDGEELMDFLCGRGKYGAQIVPKRPDLVILDLKMPKKDGYEALREIKTNPELRIIPVVVMTTSTATTDVNRSYELGACSYLHKPDSFEDLVEIVQILNKYWFETVTLPNW